MYPAPERQIRLQSKSFYPLLKIALFALIIIGLFCLIFFVFVPMFSSMFAPEPAEDIVLQPQTVVAKDPNALDFTRYIKEIIFRRRRIFNPYYNTGEIIVSEGTDNSGSPKGLNIHIVDLEPYETMQVDARKDAIKQQMDITVKNDDLLNVILNEKFIVWVDSKRNGGGSIFCKNRSQDEIFVIKEYAGRAPEISMDGDLITWNEQTGEKSSIIYLYDLSRRRNVTIATLESVPYMASPSFIGGGELVWADGEENQTEHERSQGQKSAIYSVNLKDETHPINIYPTGMYVYGPITNGSVRAWIDANNSPGATLYLGLEDNPPRKVDTDVTGYALCDNFVVYCKNEVIYAYNWTNGVFAVISKPNLKAALASARQNCVIWYDMTSHIEVRDIVNYSRIPDNAFD